MLPLYVLHLFFVFLFLLQHVHPFFVQFTAQQAAWDAAQEILKRHHTTVSFKIKCTIQIIVYSSSLFLKTLISLYFQVSVKIIDFFYYLV